MKIVLFLAVCSSYTLVYGLQRSLKEFPAANERYFFDLHKGYVAELKCLQRIDAILKTKWGQDLKKIPTADIDHIEQEMSGIEEPTKPMYNTVEQEWLMENGSTSGLINSCMRGLVPDIVPLINQDERECLNYIFGLHVDEELVHEDVFKDELQTEAQDQLPFRGFLSFTEFVELMFQSRTPDALSDLERTVYEHAESYLTTDNDRIVSTYIMTQECEWKNARALREAPSSEARFHEFVRQVKDSVYKQVANRVVKNWNLSSALPRDKYFAWLKVRENMMPTINEEVERLKNERRDAQWLCERATKFAYELSDKEVKILVGEDDSPVNLEVSVIAEEARGIEKKMKKIRDFRHPVMKNLADKYEDGTRCLTAFLHLVQNHRRFDIALSFVDGYYNYPQFYCNDKNLNLGLISTRFCKCVGSFCVHHALAALFAEEYALKRGPDGIYRVVLSGLKSREKVQSWNRD